MNTELETQQRFFLGQTQTCLFDPHPCQDNYHKNHLNTEHLIPRKAGKDHKRLLHPNSKDPRARSVIDAPENFACLCRVDHDAIDDGKVIDATKTQYKVGKMELYNRFGLTGVIEAVATYPRSPNSDLLTLQYHQWRHLFTLLDLRFRLYTDVPPTLAPDYSKAHDLVGRYLYKWARGDFDSNKILIPPKTINIPKDFLRTNPTPANPGH